MQQRQLELAAMLRMPASRMAAGAPSCSGRPCLDTQNLRLSIPRPVRTVFACRAAVGIDLGTTNSLVAVIQDGRPVVLPDDNGSVLLPSVVTYSVEGATVGLAVGQPLNTVAYVKRIIGRQFEDLSALRDELPYSLVCGEHGEALIDCPALGSAVSPVEASAEILRVRAPHECSPAKLSVARGALLNGTVLVCRCSRPELSGTWARQWTGP